MGLQQLTGSMMHQGSFAPSTSSGSSDWRRLHAAAIDRSPPGTLRADPAGQPAKRLFDLIGAGMLVALLSPVLLVIALLVRRDGGPIFFGHRRIGAHGQSFKCWKFRSMAIDADKKLNDILATDPAAREEWERTFKLKNDPRITAIGRVLRTTSLDELPQLINVLTGEMSLVGPRPIVTDEVKRYGAAFHDYARCRPGITGVWQISGRSDVGYGERVQLDRHYARNWSFGADLSVLLRTPLAVFRRSGAY